MNPTRLSLALITSAALALAASAQTGQPNSAPLGKSTDNSSTTATAPASNGYSQSTPVVNAGMSNDNSSNMNADSSMNGTMSIERVTKDSLSTKFTAKNLIDKEVYDRDQKKIGKVVDVVLSNQTSPLATSFTHSANGNMANGTSMDSSTTAPANSAAIRGTSNSVSGSTVPMPMNSDHSMNVPQGSVIIARGGMMGMGSDLIRVPLSQLSYDASSQQLKLDVSESDLVRISSTGTTTR